MGRGIPKSHNSIPRPKPIGSDLNSGTGTWFLKACKSWHQSAWWFFVRWRAAERVQRDLDSPYRPAVLSPSARAAQQTADILTWLSAKLPPLLRAPACRCGLLDSNRLRLSKHKGMAGRIALARPRKAVRAIHSPVVSHN
jgi:hypothetical protein